MTVRHREVVWAVAVAAIGGLVSGCVPGVKHESGPDIVTGASAGGGVAVPPGTRGGEPHFDPPANSVRPARPIAGGTLIALDDGRTAIATDPDRDRVFVADYAAESVLAEIALDPGDEPGRLVADSQGRVHVALRSGGAVVTLLPDPWRLGARRPVCAAPRGIAFDPRTDLVHVACAEGTLVSLPAPPDQAPVRRLALDGDLRDVVVDGNTLLVSRFRSSEVLTLDGDGQLVSRVAPASRASVHQVVRKEANFESLASEPATMTSAVAWKMVKLRNGQALLLHQRALADEITVEVPGGYGGGCGSIVETAVSAVGPLGFSRPSPGLGSVVLGVDLAVSASGDQMAVVAPGNQFLTSSPFASPQLVVLPTSDVFSEAFDCGGGKGGPAGPARSPMPGPPSPAPAPDAGDGLPEPVDARQPAGQATAVAFDKNGHILVQTRQPASIQVVTAKRQVLLGSDDRSDVGLDIFHASSAARIACASCHPEGGDDGRVWKFVDSKGKVEERRTQNLRGGILATAPFHWNGDLKDLGVLMTEVFVKRMSGPDLDRGYIDVLSNWIDGIPALPKRPARDPAAVERGHALFQSPSLGCVSCHSGALLTNNNTVDVGTGRALQVPSLRGVGWRAPFMHNGCAPDLAQRFTAACGGGDKHGVTSKLTPTQVADLAAFVETL
jgi:mono/diheme cytochrome c family protein